MSRLLLPISVPAILLLQRRECCRQATGWLFASAPPPRSVHAAARPKRPPRPLTRPPLRPEARTLRAFAGSHVRRHVLRNPGSPSSRPPRPLTRPPLLDEEGIGGLH